MNIELIKVGLEGGKNMINKIFYGTDNSTLLDPLTTIIKISLLAYKPIGTKLTIYDHKIVFDNPEIIQGVYRWGRGVKREDLHRLCHPMEKLIEWYPLDDQEYLKLILEEGIKGFNLLKTTYENKDKLNSNLVVHTLKHYINSLNGYLIRDEKRNYDSYPIISSNYKEFNNLWLKEEIKLVHDMFQIIKLKEKHNYIINTLEKFLEGKDKQFEESCYKLKNSL